MPTLVWRAPMVYRSPRDEAAFFGWLSGISGVVRVQGLGRELHIQLRSLRLSASALRELLALYHRYGGNLHELDVFANESNRSWFCSPEAEWHHAVFGHGAPA